MGVLIPAVYTATVAEAGQGFAGHGWRIKKTLVAADAQGPEGRLSPRRRPGKDSRAMDGRESVQSVPALEASESAVDDRVAPSGDAAE